MTSKMIPFPGTYQGERDELTAWVPVARLTLQAVAGPLAGQQFGFDGTAFVIGRSATCTVAIPSKGVSRAHARIEFGNGSYWLIPEQTVNGTRVNGTLVQEPRELADQDQIAIFDSTFVVHCRAPDDADVGEVVEPPPPAPPAYPQPHLEPGAQSYPTIPGSWPVPRPSAPIMTPPMDTYPVRPSAPMDAYPVRPSAPMDASAVRPSAPMMSPDGYPLLGPQGYPAAPGAWPYAPAPASIAAMPSGATPAKRWRWWVAGGAALVIVVVTIVIITVKAMQPAATPVVATTEVPAPPPTAAPEPPKPVAQPATKAAPANPVQAATKPAPEPPKPPPPVEPTPLVGTLAIEAAPLMARDRGTVVDVVRVGTAVARDAAVVHERLYSADFVQARAKLYNLQHKYGSSEDYADFIAQARQDLAIASRRRPVKPIAADRTGTVTRVKVKPGDELTGHEVVAEIAVARITVPAAAVDGSGSKCTAQLPGSRPALAGTMLSVGTLERTLELDRVPAGLPPGALGEVKIHCAGD